MRRRQIREDNISSRISADGIDLLNPDIPFPPWFRQAFREVVTGAVCDVVGAQEAFFRSIGAQALAHRAATSRVAGGCYTGPPPSLVTELLPIPFLGGQCPGTRYSVRVESIRSEGAEPTITNQTHIGPISGIERFVQQEFSGGTLIALRINSAQQISPLSGRITNFLLGEFEHTARITEIVAQIGPDDCGNLPGPTVVFPPGRELPPVPRPGDQLRPLTISPQVEVSPGNPITVPVGPFIFSPSGTVNFDLGGINVEIFPDLSVEFTDREPGSEDNDPVAFEDDVTTMLDDIAREIPDITRMLDDVADALPPLAVALEAPIQGEILGVDCAGDQIEATFSGTGLQGISAQLTAVSSVLGILLSGLCPGEGQDPEDPDFEVVSLGQFGGLPFRRFFDIDLPDDSVVLFCDATTSFPPYALAADGADDQDSIQSRFGQISFLYHLDGVFHSLPAQNQHYSDGAYEVPLNLPPGSRIRVSSYPGAIFNLSVIRRI